MAFAGVSNVTPIYSFGRTIQQSRARSIPQSPIQKQSHHPRNNPNVHQHHPHAAPSNILAASSKLPRWLNRFSSITASLCDFERLLRILANPAAIGE